MIEYGLRLGNLLQDGKSKAILVVCKLEIGVVTTIVKDREKFPLASGWYNEPIPLTEEWLIRFGFRKHRYDTRMWIKGCLTLKTNQKGYFFKWYESREYIKHVHQLQNLHFALNGKELELKKE